MRHSPLPLLFYCISPALNNAVTLPIFCKNSQMVRYFRYVDDARIVLSGCKANIYDIFNVFKNNVKIYHSSWNQNQITKSRFLHITIHNNNFELLIFCKATSTVSIMLMSKVIGLKKKRHTSQLNY